MKSLALSALALTLCAIRPAAQETTGALPTQDAKVGYSVGVSLGKSWKNQSFEFDPEFVLKGIKDALAGNQLLLTDEQIKEVLDNFSRDHRLKMEEKRRQLGEQNKQEGQKFLDENKKKQGVIALPGGLQYKVLHAGTGPSPKTNDTVTIQHRGTLLDGTEFDSSQRRGQPATFTPSEGGVVQAWVEAIPLMNVGSKWQLFVPAELAYGERGYGSAIGPNAALIYEIELLSFTSPPPLPEAVTSDIIKVPSAEELAKGAKIEVIKADQLKKE